MVETPLAFSFSKTSSASTSGKIRFSTVSKPIYWMMNVSARSCSSISRSWS